MIKTFGNNIILTPVQKDEKTESGIVLSEHIKKNGPQKGTCVSVGKDVKEVQIGDTVLFKGYALDEFHIDHKPYLCVSENDVYCIENN